MGKSPSQEEARFAIEMNASPELTRRVWKSYGATTIIFEYLGQKEAHKFQGADKWMYKRGVCRVFVRVTLREGVQYFLDFRNGLVIRYEPVEAGLISVAETSSRKRATALSSPSFLSATFILFLEWGDSSYHFFPVYCCHARITLLGTRVGS